MMILSQEACRFGIDKRTSAESSVNDMYSRTRPNGFPNYVFHVLIMTFLREVAKRFFVCNLLQKIADRDRYCLCRNKERETE